MSIVGIIFSNLNDGNNPELTQLRATGSIPFGGRYRLIDFVLSNMVNSGVTKVGVITKNNYQSLMDHIGTGKEWDLARKSGGLILLPPFGGRDSDSLYTTRLEALKGIMSFIKRSTEEYAILSDCDMVCNIDFNDVIAFHEANKSDITTVYCEAVLDEEEAKKATTFKIDPNGRITEVSSNSPSGQKVNHYIKLIVLKKQLLQGLVLEAISHGKKDFIMEILAASLDSLSCFAYRYDGYYANISSLAAYYQSNMGLLQKEKRDALFNVPDRPIYTKVKDSPPTRYGENSKVKNSFIADGCNIEGEVENSIIFRGAHISQGAVIKNCIILLDNIIGKYANLDCVITDKNVVIKDKRVLSGAETLPFFIGKGRIV